jgi:lysophospholipase L1-like esterase
MIRMAREGHRRGAARHAQAGLPPSIPAFYGEIAAAEGVPFEEGAIRSVLFDNRLKSDFVHPNAQGYAEIAASVQKLLKRSGAI